jgi:hypothetical protein
MRPERRGNARAMFLVPRNLLLVAYLVFGVIVAASKDYLENLDTAKRLLSALLAIALWPLLLLGIDLRID